MPPTLSRRDFLRSAGGITFLALTPIGRGVFAATQAAKPAVVPLFAALPYIQPGPDSKLVPDKETVRVAWQTEPREADFIVDFGPTENYGRTAAISRSARDYTKGNVADGRYNYVCSFENLALGTPYFYRVRCNNEVIVKGFFTTRQARGRRIRFAAFGDTSCGALVDHAIAYRVYKANPDFVMHLGDNVYDHGWDDEYRRNFFPVYNADTARPETGAPILRSVPFYTILGNHDLNVTDPQTRRPAVDFAARPDSLGYYTNFYFPLNGPEKTNCPTTVRAANAEFDNFAACAAARYPKMANYSYDYGDAHFLCLDGNTYVDPLDQDLHNWITADLAATDARWKIVAYHQPAFDMGNAHFTEQQMRPLSPLFEKGGVDIVLSGHEHNYQRTKPMRFAPGDLARAQTLYSTNRLVPGQFTLDEKFDGDRQAKPDGVIYITSGGGGQSLHDPGFTGQPEKWVHPQDNNVPYCAKFISDRHSFSLFEIDGAELTMRQFDEYGTEIDRIRVAKS